MSKETIAEMIKLYRKGNENILTEIWIQMQPLIKNQARRTHFMEYDDACQEYSIALIEAINKIQTYDTDGQCLKYIATCIKNKFCFLYKRYCSGVANEIFDDIVIDDSDTSNTYDDVVFFADIADFIEKIPSEVKRNIASLSILQQKSDAEIALQLGLSRQYINRIKKELYRELSNLYK